MLFVKVISLLKWSCCILPRATFSQDLLILLRVECIAKDSFKSIFSPRLYFKLIDIPDSSERFLELRRREHRITAIPNATHNLIFAHNCHWYVIRLARDNCPRGSKFMRLWCASNTCLFVVFSSVESDWRVNGFCLYSRIQPVFMRDKRKCAGKTGARLYNPQENMSAGKAESPVG